MLKSIQIFFVSCFTICLTACGNNQAAPESISDSPTATGEALFRQNGCHACHAVVAGVDTPNVGPNLAGLGIQAAQHLANPAYTGQADSVEAYLQESILLPEIYLVEGFQPIMPNTYSAVLTDEQVEALVAYMVSLK